MSWEEAENDPAAKFLKVKQARVNKDTKTEQRIRCGLVAQELSDGSKDDELFAGTPSLTAMKLTKEDQTPGEVIDGLFIGSVGAAYNQKSL